MILPSAPYAAPPIRAIYPYGLDSIGGVGMRARLLGVAALLCVGVTSVAYANTIPLVDEGPITYDPNTGLEWLDLTVTRGWSLNQTLASPYVTNDGFRAATQSELRSLYADVGITFQQSQNPWHTSSDYSLENGPGVSTLLRLLGCTFQCNGPSPAGQGWLDVGSSTGTLYAFYQLGACCG